jgi:choline dehydrogenase-like flavoprotein
VPEPNDALRAARQRLGSPSSPGQPMTRQELAEAEVFRLTQKVTEIDANHIGKWERGDIRWPADHYRRALRNVLDSVYAAAIPSMTTPKPQALAKTEYAQLLAGTEHKDEAAKLGIEVLRVGFRCRRARPPSSRPTGHRRTRSFSRAATGKTDAANLLVHPQASGCTFCGHCFQGCYLPQKAPRNLIAKRSTDNSYVPMALTAAAWSAHGKPITLVTDAYVTQLHVEDVFGNVTARGVTWRDNSTGETHREDAKVVVLAAGAVETPRLWLNSNLPNPNSSAAIHGL